MKTTTAQNLKEVVPAPASTPHPTPEAPPREPPPGITFESEYERILEALRNAHRADYLFGLAFANITEFGLWSKDPKHRYHSGRHMFAELVDDVSLSQLDRLARVVRNVPNAEKAIAQYTASKLYQLLTYLPLAKSAMPKDPGVAPISIPHGDSLIPKLFRDCSRADLEAAIKHLHGPSTPATKKDDEPAPEEPAAPSRPAAPVPVAVDPAIEQLTNQFVKQWFELLSAGKVDEWQQSLDPGVQFALPGVDGRGAPSLRKAVDDHRTAFPDLKLTLNGPRSTAASSCIEVTLKGTHTGPYPTPLGRGPPTQKPVTVTGVITLGLLAGLDGTRVRSFHWYFDRLDMLLQLGVVNPA